MAVTRINNNQITDSSAGNAYLGINAGTKLQNYSITAQKIANNLTYGSDLTVTGNLTVSGTSTAVNTTVTTIEDPTITLASTQTGTPVSDIGFLGQRGTSTNVAWIWKESALEFESVYTSTTGVSNGSPTVTVTGFANIHMGNANIGGNTVHNGTTSFVGNLIGAVNATANITGGNLLTPGIVSATANITGGNVLTGGLISATGTITGGNVSATANVTGGNVLTGGIVSATANITGGNILTPGIVSAGSGLIGNLQVGNIIPTANVTYTLGNLTNQWKSLYISGNTIYMGNLQLQQPAGTANTLQVTGPDGTTLGGINVNTISAQGNITGGNLLTGGLISAAATVTGGNLATGGTASVTGNITGGNLTTAGQVVATANVTGGNITTGGQVSATGNITATANVTGGNVLTGGAVSATGTITGGNLVTGGTASVTGTATVGNLATSGTSSATGSSTAGSYNTAGNVSATGNVTGGNVLTGGAVSATGNVTGGNVKTNYIYTITTGDTLTVNAATISLNPTANVGMNSRYINSLADPVQAQDAATKNYVDSVAQGLDPKASVVYATTTSIFGSGYTYNNGTSGVGATLTASAVGNLTIDGTVVSVGQRVLIKNETGAYTNNTTQSAAFNGIYVVTTAGSPSAAYVLTRSTDMDQWSEVPNAFTFVEQGTTNSDTGWVSTANQGGTMGTTSITWTQFSGAGSYSAGNALSLTGTQFNVLWDQTANATIGLNGSNQLYIPAGAVLTTPNIGAATGTSLSVTGTVTATTYNGTTFSASGNVTGGNVLTGGVVSATGNVAGGNINTAGTASATGTVTGGNLATGGTASAGGNITGANLLTGGAVSATSTITGGNLATGGTISGTGNVTGGNVLTGGIVSATGNITGNYYFGNGSQLTGVSAATSGFPVIAGTSNIAAATSGNIGITIGGTSNVVTIATSGEYVTGLISANGNVIGGNITTVGNVSATANVAGGNVTTGGIVSATGNVTGGNVRTAGVVSATGDLLTAGNILAPTGYISAALGLVATSNYANAYSDGIVVDYVTGNGRISVGTADGLQFFNSGVGNVKLGYFDSNGNLQVGNTGTGTITSGSHSVTGTVSATGNINAGNLITTGSAQGGNIVLIGNSIQELNPGGTITMNLGNANTNFAVNGTAANVFFVNATTNTVSFGSSTQTTNAIAAFNSSTSILLPVGNTSQRPGTGVTGMQRFNTQLNALEIYNNSTWQTVGATIFTVISDDQFTGNGVATTFTLSSSQTTNSCIVSINGVVQIPTTAYSVSGTTLTFTEAPAIGDLIDVRELTTTTSVTSVSNSNGTAVVAPIDGTNTVAITGNVIPVANVAYNLGNATNYWKSLYVGGNTIYLGSLQLKDNGSNTFAVYAADGTTPATVSVGNISVSSIVDGTSSYGFLAPNGNAIIAVGGANITTVASTGIYTTGLSSVTGNIIGGNLTTAGQVSATGNVTGNYLLGNAYYVTGLSPTQIYSGTSNVTVTGSGANISVAVGGTPNVAVFATTGEYVTGVVSASGNVTGGNVLTGGIVSATANITGGNVNTGGNVSGAWMLPTTGVSTGGNILVGGYLSVVGNLYVANVVSQGNLVVTDPLVYFQNTSSYPYNYDIGFYSAFTGGTGNTYQHSGVVRDYVDNTWKIASNIPEPAGTTLDFTNAIYDNVKMGNLAVVGNVTATTTISATGTITGGNLATAGTASVGGNITTGGNIIATGNATANIGSLSNQFNTIFAKATSAQYADLAEKYTADAEYAPGTVVVFGGAQEVTVNAVDADRKVAGVITTNPSYIMNSGLNSEFVATVALTGRVPCMVVGPVKKGDLMVAAGLGRARAEADPKVGSVIGKALEDFDDAEGTIEVVVGRF